MGAVSQKLCLNCNKAVMHARHGNGRICKAKQGAAHRPKGIIKPCDACCQKVSRLP